MRLLNGNILVSPQMRNDKILLSNGKELFIDTRFGEGEHAEIVCDVIAVPEEKIVPMRKLAGDWECDMDIEVGDEVYCDYRFVNLELKSTENIIYFNKRRCIIINYKNIFVAKRKNEIIMLNGYVLLEPYHNKRILFSELEKKYSQLEKTGIKIPDYIWEKSGCRMGIIRYIGKPNKKYNTQKSKWVDSEDIRVGDIVIFEPERDIFLEYSLHAKLEGKKQFYRVQNHDILMKIEF